MNLLFDKTNLGNIYLTYNILISLIYISNKNVFDKRLKDE